MTEANTVSAAPEVRAAVPPVPMLVRTRRGLAAARLALPGPVVLVPTMGALHDGHRSPLRMAREHAGPDGSVVVSIFVNPLQFGPAEDFDRYPRPIEHDLAVCAQEGVTAVFRPSVAQMYPTPPMVTVNPGPAGQLVAPDAAVFGAKDAQQLALIRTMVIDLDLGVQILEAPLHREPDGLAASSRNVYLSVAERASALMLSRALDAARAAAVSGAPQAVAAARAIIDLAASASPPVQLDYLVLADPDSFAEVAADHTGPAILLVAAKVGGTRLIDNVRVEVGGPS
jgi:pantoate--beta-alanine ligase